MRVAPLKAGSKADSACRTAFEPEAPCIACDEPPVSPACLPVRRRPLNGLPGRRLREYAMHSGCSAPQPASLFNYGKYFKMKIIVKRWVWKIILRVFVVDDDAIILDVLRATLAARRAAHLRFRRGLPQRPGR